MGLGFRRHDDVYYVFCKRCVNMSEKRICDSCIHRSYPTGQRYEYFESKDIYIRDNLTGERFYMSDLDMLCNLLNNYDKDWQRKRVERTLELQKECFKTKDMPIEKKNCGRCKHFHLDGMFGFWCEKDHNWTLMENCLDFEGD